MTREEVLDNENELLRERIKVLEAALGVTFPVPRSFGLTPHEQRLLGALLKRDVLTSQQAMLALYNDRNDIDLPEPKIVDVRICKIRAKLKPLGITIATHWGQGWSMSPADKAKVNEATRLERECMG